jgi:hypothetical protein
MKLEMGTAPLGEPPNRTGSALGHSNWPMRLSEVVHQPVDRKSMGIASIASTSREFGKRQLRKG